MKARVLPAGDTALLVEVADVDEVLALTEAIRGAVLGEAVSGVSTLRGTSLEETRSHPLDMRVVDLVPAARTVLVQTRDGADLARLAGDLQAIAAGIQPRAAETDHDEVVIETRYDGVDLDEVAKLAGLSTDEVVAHHTGSTWRAAFVGFAPGFSYLTGGSAALRVPRRPEARTSVPAGSVALAGEYTAVYPRTSPGGWQLIGTTDAPLWELDRTPPALLPPGTWVRFVAVRG